MSFVTVVALDRPETDNKLGALLEELQQRWTSLGHEVRLFETGAEGTHRDTGIARHAVLGIRESDGEIVLIVDATRPYTASDFHAVASPILDGEADLVVGCSNRVGVTARLLAPVARTVAPWSGLVAVRRDVVLASDSMLRPVGERFALELAQRVDGRRLDVILPRRPGDRPRGWHFDDVRHLKRLADDRLGTFSRFLQFCVVGASGMIVDLTLYALLQYELKHTKLAEMTLPVIGSSLDLAVAGLCSVFIALLWNFSLNRRLTFNDAKKVSVAKQFVTYVLSNALGISLSLTLRLSLPRWIGFFDRHRLAAAVVGIVASTGVSFAMARWLVFPHDRPEESSVTETVAASDSV